MWKIAGSKARFNVDFLVEDQFVKPDVGSIAFLIRDASGTAILDQPISDPTGTSTILEVPAEANILVSATFEPRYVEITFKYLGHIYTQTFSYYISAFVPLTKTVKDARILLGVEIRELPDDELDLMAAYFTLLSNYGTNFYDSICSNGSIGIAANKSVLIKAILDIFSSIQNRVLLRERSDTAEFQRNKANFDKLRTDLEVDLANQLGLIPTIAAETVAFASLVFQVSAPTDPITGA